MARAGITQEHDGQGAKEPSAGRVQRYSFSITNGYGEKVIDYMAYIYVCFRGCPSLLKI